MVFKDLMVRCGACGKTFVYTVREQRARAERGLSVEPPAICPECRGADVRLAEAATPAPAAATATRSPEAARSAGPPDRRERRGGGGGSYSGGGRRHDDRPPRRDGPPRQGGSGVAGRGRGPAQGRDKRGRGPGGGRRPPRQQTELRLRHVGVVKWFDVERGFGFIAQDEDGSELFVHASGILSAAEDRVLREGQPVEYEVEHTARGLQAVDVVALGL